MSGGRPLTRVFRIVNEASRKEVENPALRALREGVVVGLANHTVLIARGGGERPFDDSAAPKGVDKVRMNEVSKERWEAAKEGRRPFPEPKPEQIRRK